MVAKVRTFSGSDLLERHSVALQLADAFVIDQGKVDAGLREIATSILSRDEITDIGLEMFRVSANKVRVALGMDSEPDSPISSLEPV